MNPDIITIELEDLEVRIAKHPDRPVWFVVVWPAGARARALAQGRGPEGEVVAFAYHVAGVLGSWRFAGDPLERRAIETIAHAVTRVVAVHDGGA